MTRKIYKCSHCSEKFLEYSNHPYPCCPYCYNLQTYEIDSEPEQTKISIEPTNIEKLIGNRKKAIRDAYLQLPDLAPNSPDGLKLQIYLPSEFGDLFLVKTDENGVPLFLDKHETAEFVIRDGRWVMTVEEYNRIIYKGAYL